jgi:threonine aldolase
MHQTGFLAGCAAYALTHNFPKLPRAHALALKLEEGLMEIGAKITSAVETCMVRTRANCRSVLFMTFFYQVFYDPTPLGLSYAEISERANQLPEPLKLGSSRLLVHTQTSEQTIDDFLTLMRTLADEKKAAGLVPLDSKLQINGFKNVAVLISKALA